MQSCWVHPHWHSFLGLQSGEAVKLNPPDPCIRQFKLNCLARKLEGDEGTPDIYGYPYIYAVHLNPSSCSISGVSKGIVTALFNVCRSAPPFIYNYLKYRAELVPCCDVMRGLYESHAPGHHIYRDNFCKVALHFPVDRVTEGS